MSSASVEENPQVPFLNTTSKKMEPQKPAGKGWQALKSQTNQIKINAMATFKSLNNKSVATLHTGVTVSEGMSRKEAIVKKRGAFHWLPVLCGTDAAHGSWWYVWGCVVCTLSAFFCLLDVWYDMFHVPPDTALPMLANYTTWFLVIISGWFSCVGCYGFARAFEDPQPMPMFPGWYHLSTDELVGAWMTTLSVAPMIPYAVIYLIDNSDTKSQCATNWAVLVGSVISTLLCLVFVYMCYPVKEEEAKEVAPLIHPCVVKCFGPKSCLSRHTQNDFLVFSWLTFIFTAIATLGCAVLFFKAENNRQLFVYGTTFIEAVIFLIGGAYYVAGAYADAHRGDTEDAKLMEMGSDKSYH